MHQLIVILFLSIAAARVWANPVLDWTEVMISAIRLDNSGPTLSTRNLAILHTTMFDAVNSVLRTHQPYRALTSMSRPVSADAAAVGAAHSVLSALYPGLTADSERALEDFIFNEGLSDDIVDGLALGAETARSALAARANDGSSTEITYIPDAAPGGWRRTPPFFRPPVTPHWRFVQPFGIDRVEVFVPGPPPAMESLAYAAAVEEVKRLGGKSSLERTAYQTETAVFWSDFSYTSMPPGHWHLIAIGIARSRELDLPQTARLFALLSIAQADASIVCWEAKYRYNLWRPVTAIQRAEEDGNPLTIAAPDWDHLLAAPPFPSYTSGHSTFSAASAEVIARYFGTDDVHFTATSDSLPGKTRVYTNLTLCAEEIGMSRIYGGIHFSFDNEAGRSSGRKIGAYVSQNYLHPLSRLPFLQFLTNSTTTSGEAILRVHAPIPSVFNLESSPDLRSWTTISSHTAQIGGTLVPFPRGASAQFFRVQSGSSGE